jgi:hypothetical protein
MSHFLFLRTIVLAERKVEQDESTVENPFYSAPLPRRALLERAAPAEKKAIELQDGQVDVLEGAGAATLDGSTGR